MQFIDLAAQYLHLKHKIDARIHEVLNHGNYIMGPEVEELEQKLAEYVGVKHVVSCANGTDALQLSLMALGIGEGDAVIVPPFTFFATAEAVAIVGAEPVFSDIEISTYNLCPTTLEKTILHYKKHGCKNLKAVMAVDLFGLPANYSVIETICKNHNLLLIEDGAQGFGGAIKGKKVGAFGDIATTSFFPAKPLGCYGDGGAIFTNNDEYASLLKSLRVHGKGVDKYDNVRIGLNSRLDTLQAAILLEKLAVFDDELLARNNVALRYNNAFESILTIPKTPKNYQSAWAQYSVISETTSRALTIEKLKQQGIPSAIYYPKPLHLCGAMENLHYKKGDFPNSESASEHIFSLPMHPYLHPEEQNIIIETLAELVT